MPPSIFAGTPGGGCCGGGYGNGGGGPADRISCRLFAFNDPPSLEILRSLLRDSGRLSNSSSNALRSSGVPRPLPLGVWSVDDACESCLSPLNAPRIVCVVVWRRRRGFMGGTGGVCMPLFRLAPGGRPMVGTLEVEETKVGSEIRVLLTGRLGRTVCPGARWGTTWLAAAAKVGAGGEVGSGVISYRGGVALAEYGGAMGEGLGDVPIMAAGGGGRFCGGGGKSK